jgi:hypothetical protein
MKIEVRKYITIADNKDIDVRYCVHKIYYFLGIKVGDVDITYSDGDRMLFDTKKEATDFKNKYIKTINN